MKDTTRDILIECLMITIAFIFVCLLIFFSIEPEEKRRECFKECYVMNMDTCETFDEHTCKKFDQVVRLYCCHECDYKTTTWWETYKDITLNDILINPKKYSLNPMEGK